MAEETTRDKLRDAAMRLYSERGVFQVSLAEIVRAAGQRNASAIHYHFGSRDQILVEILRPYARVVRERRLELLSAVETDDGVRPIVEAMVRPITELARLGWRERAYLRIGMDVAEHPDQVGAEVTEVVGDTGAREAFELIMASDPGIAAEVVRWRLAICVGVVGRAAAERAQGQAASPSIAAWTDEEFTAHLVDIYLAVITGASSASVPRVRRRTG